MDSYSEQLRQLGTTRADGSRICWHDSIFLSVVNVFIKDSAVKYEHGNLRTQFAHAATILSIAMSWTGSAEHVSCPDPMVRYPSNPMPTTQLRRDHTPSPHGKFLEPS